MDRIDGVTIFIEVAERGSFADAARRLGRSPTAVTRAVAELEARLGVRLLNRTTRAVSVTEAGQRFLAGAKRVVADLDEIERALGRDLPEGDFETIAGLAISTHGSLPEVGDIIELDLPLEALVSLVYTFNKGIMLERLSGIETGHRELLDWIEGWLEERTQ